ncbi:hypothetical protein FG87_38270 [Nocardia vulneris]|uniref:Uncharacterized protein n=1 Tax=Nocardia vulneris TaxID=1141657 RepID=A0ABR4Z4P2_9NOCA|nr:hypothetical protein FG87_38270 [Nocardia vulneris]
MEFGKIVFDLRAVLGYVVDASIKTVKDFVNQIYFEFRVWSGHVFILALDAPAVVGGIREAVSIVH